MKLAMDKEAISERLRQVGELSDLDPARRLDAKLDLSPEGITRRLREAFELYELCRRLERWS